MPEEEYVKVYSTKDLTLAATLMTLQFHLVNIDYQVEGANSRLVGYFAFEDTPKLQETIDNFMQRDLMVEPLSFMTNLKSLKAQINTIYKGPHTNEKFYRR